MIPTTLSFLNTIHIFAAPRTRFFHIAPICMGKNVEWKHIVDLRCKHQDVKLKMSEVARNQKLSDTLQEYMALEAQFSKLMARDSALRRVIPRLLKKYLEQQKT